MTWKKRNIIIITMNFLALLLYMTTMLQRENPIGQTLTVILLAASGSLLVIRMETHMAFHAQTKQLQYQNLDLFRFLSSIIIIVLHARPFFTVSYEIDMAINNIIGRICVPFFFFISGYFAAKQEQKKPDYIRSYIRSMIPVYLLWSAVYLPWSLSLAAPYIQQVSGLLCTIGLPTAIQNLLLLLLVPVLSSLVFPGTSAFHACSALVEEEVFPKGTAYGFLCSSAVWRHRDLLRLLRSVFPIPASLLLCGFFHNP